MHKPIVCVEFFVNNGGQNVFFVSVNGESETNGKLDVNVSGPHRALEKALEFAKRYLSSPRFVSMTTHQEIMTKEPFIGLFWFQEE